MRTAKSSSAGTMVMQREALVDDLDDLRNELVARGGRHVGTIALGTGERRMDNVPFETQPTQPYCVVADLLLQHAPPKRKESGWRRQYGSELSAVAGHGKAHARGYQASGGFKLIAVADLIPSRRREMIDEFKIPREYATWEELVADKELDAVSVCLPTHLHAAATIAALRAGKHVVCERPPTLSGAEAKRIETAATKAKKIVLYGMQRRFGGAEMATKQAIIKGYAGKVYHARHRLDADARRPDRHRLVTDREKAGGGALMDLGSVMLDLGWQPARRTQADQRLRRDAKAIAGPGSRRREIRRRRSRDGAGAL